MKKKFLAVVVILSMMSSITLLVSASPQEEWGEGWNVEKGDLEGPDYIQPPKHYKTLETMLVEAGIVEQPVKRGLPSRPVSGTRDILVIMVELSGVAPDAAHTSAYFNGRFFNTTPPSVRDYYTEVSYNTFTYVPGVVLGWYPSTYDQAQWVNIDPRHVVVEAIQDADPFFNFAPYDTNSDGTVTNEELTIFIIVSGYQGRAFHWWTAAPVVTADGVSVEGEFSATHEWRHIGSYCHELGHDLGLPDLYDTDATITGDSEGIGNYGLMGGGSWTFSHMTAWSKIQLGWITPTVVTVDGYFDVRDAETHDEAYVLIDPTHSTDEYFLVENRCPQNSYYESVGPPVAPGGTFPDDGILIYHIDEARVQDWINFGTNNINVDETHKGVDVETAEHPTSHFVDADDLDAEVNRGDAGDIWDINECNFNDISIPCNAIWYDGMPSGMGVTNFTLASSTMRVYLSARDPVPKGLHWLRAHQNTDGSWTGDAGANVGYTSLAALAFLNYGVDESDPTISKAINYILSNQQADGSIWNHESNYETSLAILPLVATHNSSYDDNITTARNFLVDIQNDGSEGINESNWTYGGWGYGANSSTWSDLSNTQWSLMGLDAANLSETSGTWNNATLYVTRCQNWQATNPYAVTNDGGFTYQPPNTSMAWGCGGDPGQSYGAMSAAGVWSLRLCGVDTSDQRVQKGLNWLRDNYAPIDTVGNPCYGDTYLYYYLLSFAKTLIMTEIPSGSWQETASQDITDYIVSQQHDDGHWSSNEGDLFATEQAILALQTRTIPTNVQRLSWLTFILHSNADLHVYDPLGRHVGMNYDTGEIEIEIPSATYSADPQNITIPELIPGNYRIVLVGTGTGEYTLDVTGGVGDDIVAADSFTSAISEGEVHDADVNVAMITWLTIHIEEPEPIYAMVESATGTGKVSFVSDAGTIEDLTALNESDLPEEMSADFPHGLFSFNITGLSNGETVNVTINFPQDIPTTAQYWKYHASSGEWYQVPIGSNGGDNIITITLQDGGIGDNDGATNGIISDPGAPGVISTPPSAASASAIGAPIDRFRMDADVYATGSRFTTANVDIYVVPDQDWNNGNPIPPDVTGAVETVSVVAGAISTVRVWHAPLVIGEYDIVVDANQNGVYDASTDGLDSGSPGFVVIASVPVPALTPLGLIALIGLLCVAGVGRIRRRFN